MQAAQSNTALLKEMHQYHTLALANLATVTQSDITSVTLLTKTVSELLSQFSTLTARLATEQSENASLKNRDIVWPRPSTAIGIPAIRPHQIRIRSKTAMSIRVSETNSTLKGISHIKGTRSRSHTRPQVVASR